TAAIASCFYSEDAAFVRFHGVDGVVHDIEEHLHELITISTNAGKHGLELQFDSRLGRAIERAKLNRVGDDCIDVEKRALRWNLTRKAQEIADERLCPASLISNLRGGGPSFVVQRRVIREQVGKAKNCGERIVDFMRRAC